MTKIAPEQLLSEVEDLLRTMPPKERLNHDEPENVAWFGRAVALVNLWDSVQAVFFRGNIDKACSSKLFDSEQGLRNVLTTLHQVRHELRLSTVGPLTVAVNQGQVFDYFDEVRKVIETAKIDLFFVDPFLDTEFVSRYLTHVTSGTTVRLLTRKNLATLIPAVELLRQQQQLAVEVRSINGLHDRYVFVDRQTCYHSGASFQDGAKKAPTTLTQIVDTFDVVYSTYQNKWDSASIQ